MKNLLKWLFQPEPLEHKIERLKREVSEWETFCHYEDNTEQDQSRSERNLARLKEELTEATDDYANKVSLKDLEKMLQ